MNGDQAAVKLFTFCFYQLKYLHAYHVQDILSTVYICDWFWENRPKRGI